MGSKGAYFTVFGLIVITIWASVFCDPSSSHADISVDKPSDGLSTDSDTLFKESQAISLDGLSVEQLQRIRDEAAKQQFQTEVDRMMKLIINSLYKNKEIFLRELISNASDALDKIRMLSLTQPDILNTSPELLIRIKANKEARTLHIIDTGIGMTQEELSSNLGTIARSGTSEFLAKLAESRSPTETSDLIGQFGVGFYSSFLVADKVMVISKSNDDKQYIWESDSKSYSVFEDPRGDTLKRGTEIVLHLSEEAEDYLQPDTLKEVVKRYSPFIPFPIYLWASHVETVNVEPEEKSETDKKSDVDASVEEEKKTEPKMVEKVIWDWVLINEQKPIWMRKPSEISDSEYSDLYRSHSGDHDGPLAKIHFSAEGDISFSSILYIPKRAPSNLFQMHSSHSNRIKLYVRRVFISDVAEDMMPKYLAFILGIVDSDQLPLNVSRETLQQNKLLKMIKKKLVRKVIEMISKLSEEDFDAFWKEYSVNIKLGIMDDHSNRSKLSKLLRFHTSNSGDKLSTLADYVKRMKGDQDAIYYLTGASLDEVKSSPLVERLIKKGYEVIYMTDPIDEYMVQSLTEFEKKKLQNVAKEGLELDKSEEAKNQRENYEKDYKPLLDWLKEEVLKDKVEKVVLSERLSDSPCALVAAQYGWSGNMERIMRAQAYQKGGDPSVSYYANMNKILEINPRHPLIRELNGRVKVDRSDPDIRHTAQLLFDIATLRSGYAIKDPVLFAERIESIMRKNLDVDLHEKAVEEEPSNRETESDRLTDEEMDETQPVHTKDTPPGGGEPVTADKNDNTPDAKDEL